MLVLKLSSKGQPIIPAAVRTAHQWQAGDEFVLEERREGLLLKPRTPFPASRLDDVVGCLPYAGAAKTIEEMDEAKRWTRRLRRGIGPKATIAVPADTTYLIDPFLVRAVARRGSAADYTLTINRQ